LLPDTTSFREATWAYGYDGFDAQPMAYTAAMIGEARLVPPNWYQLAPPLEP